MTTQELVKKSTENWNKSFSVSLPSYNVSCSIEKGRVAFYLNGVKTTRKIVEGLIGK